MEVHDLSASPMHSEMWYELLQMEKRVTELTLPSLLLLCNYFTSQQFCDLWKGWGEVEMYDFIF